MAIRVLADSESWFVHVGIVSAHKDYVCLQCLITAYTFSIIWYAAPIMVADCKGL